MKRGSLVPALLIAALSLVPFAPAAEPDCNANGIPDAQDLAPQHPGVARAGTIDRGDAYPPWSMELVDLEGDGILDRIEALGDVAGMAILHGRGDGRFAGPVPLPGRNLSPFAIADFDRDGLPDLACLEMRSEGARNALIFLHPGDGPLSPSFLRFDGLPNALTAADMDGDGFPDLVFAIAPYSAGFTVLIERNRNAGTAWEAWNTEVDLPYIQSLGHADLDGDGTEDLAAFTSSGVSLIWNGGTGAFEAEEIAGMPPSRGEVLEDLDEDGRPDIAIAQRESIAVLLGRGARAFDRADVDISPLVPFRTRALSNLLAAADVDGDGLRDLILLGRRSPSPSPGSLAFLWNQGGGLFGPLQETELEDTAISLTAGDIAGDAAPEVLISSSGRTGLEVFRRAAVARSLDCNGNGIPDECDIASGASVDCDRNGIPDECGQDLDRNGRPDACDIADGTSADCNGNRIPDAGDGPPPFSVRLDIEGCPDALVGFPGEVRTFDAFLTLTTAGNPRAEGATSWEASLEIGGGAIRDFSMDELAVTTIRDDDGDPTTAPLDPHPFPLQSAPFRGWWPASEGGVVFSARLQSTKRTSLQPNGTERIARVTVEARIPEDSACSTLSLRYRDGLMSQGSVEPATNRIAYPPVDSICPDLGAREVRVCRAAPFIRGDANADGRLDIADPIRIIGGLFFAGSPPAACAAAADANDDGRVDIADAQHLIAYTLLGGRPPGAPFPGCGWAAGGASGDLCPSGSTGCR